MVSAIPKEFIDKTGTITKYFGFEPIYIIQSDELTQIVYQFPNHYGASIIQAPYSFGGKQGLWELAVINSIGELVYDTEITKDVIGFLSPHEVEPLLYQISNL